MASAAYDDSGHRAIVGYFYQTVMTAGLVLELEEALRKDTEHDGHEAMFVVRPEEYGQDAIGAATAGNKTIAKVVQHKFSETPDAQPIQPSELFEIIEKLDEAAQRITSKYKCVPVPCLHTNRPLSPDSRAMFEAAKNGSPSAKLDDVVEIKAKGKKGKVRNEGRTLEKNKRYRDSLKRLEYDRRAITTTIEALEHRARAFGLLQHELEPRLKQIEAEIFAGASRATARQVTLADLDKWLTADVAPRQICSISTAAAIRQQLDRECEYLDRDEPLLSRTAMRALQESIAEPIVQVFGDGGVGKSATIPRRISCHKTGRTLVGDFGGDLAQFL